MRHTLRFIVALAALTVAYLGLRSWAQDVPNPAAPKAPDATKVGVVNIGTVYAQYTKVKIFRLEVELAEKPYKDEQERLKKLGMEWDKALKTGKLDAKDEELGRKTVHDVRVQLEDADGMGRRRSSKKEEDTLADLYREVCEAVKKHAEAHGFHLILAYGEPVGDPMTLANVKRKKDAMNQGEVVLMYSAGAEDISEAVLADLNGTAERK